jgi:hypothetical protein
LLLKIRGVFFANFDAEILLAQLMSVPDLNVLLFLEIFILLVALSPLPSVRWLILQKAENLQIVFESLEKLLKTKYVLILQNIAVDLNFGDVAQNTLQFALKFLLA